MIIENLQPGDLKRIANRFAQKDWKLIHPIDKWKGFDLECDEYIFQLGYEGSMCFWLKDPFMQIPLDINSEELIRSTLNDILRR